MQKHLLFLWTMLLILFVTGLFPTSLQAAPAATFRPDPFSHDLSGDYLCPIRIAERQPEFCSVFSPGAEKIRLNYLRARLPNPLPALPIQEIPVPEGPLTQYTFAYIRHLPAPTYADPSDIENNVPPIRTYQEGDNWLSVLGSVEYNGQTWYQVGATEFIPADRIVFGGASRFHGVTFTEQPEYPFGWILRDVAPSPLPGEAPRADTVYKRYEMVTIFAEEPRGASLWYMIGPDLWVEQGNVARVDIRKRPEEIERGEKWIDVNTFEQTLSAYEGAKIVFATLISSGRPGETWTPDGLFRIWGKLPTTPMMNREVDMANPAWYSLDNVEWTQYFNKDIALHAAYWHNSFGFTRSHGCVNLSLTDSKWLYEWTTPAPSPTGQNVMSTAENPGTWIWVHRTPPTPDYEP